MHGHGHTHLCLDKRLRQFPLRQRGRNDVCERMSKVSEKMIVCAKGYWIRLMRGIVREERARLSNQRLYIIENVSEKKIVCAKRYWIRLMSEIVR